VVFVNSKLWAMQNNYRKIREMYGLSRAGMSKVLGMGVNQWRRYENGISFPVGAYERLIRMVRDPKSMLKVLRENERVLRGGGDVGLGNRGYEVTVRRCEEILSGYEAVRQVEYEKWVEGLYQ
jgi:transcriptional regulator with XRE-family HTH domain